MEAKNIVLILLAIIGIYLILPLKEGFENSKKSCKLPDTFGKQIKGVGKRACSEGGVLAPGSLCDIGCEDKYQYDSGRNVYGCSEGGVLSENNLKCRKKSKPQKINRENITFICEPKFTELIDLLRESGIIKRPERDYSGIINSVQSKSKNCHKKPSDKSSVQNNRMNRKIFPGNTGADSKPYNSLMDMY